MQREQQRCITIGVFDIKVFNLRLDIIIPVLNEAALIGPALERLQTMRERGARLIVVDGGSSDDTVRRAAALADRVLIAGRGRAVQMNAGARDSLANSQADVLLFLNVDTQLPEDATRLIARALAGSARLWGRFDLRAIGDTPHWRALSTVCTNWYSRITGICNGEQAIFVERGAWLALQGFAPIAMLEDIEFSSRARTLSRPAVPAAKALSNGERKQCAGRWRNLRRHYSLRLEYFFGADPDELARRYRKRR